MDEAGSLGAGGVHVTANRNALAFYEAVGFLSVGELTTELGPTGSLMVKLVHTA
jgi:hypothetical protein